MIFAKGMLDSQVQDLVWKILYHSKFLLGSKEKIRYLKDLQGIQLSQATVIPKSLKLHFYNCSENNKWAYNWKNRVSFDSLRRGWGVSYSKNLLILKSDNSGRRGTVERHDHKTIKNYVLRFKVLSCTPASSLIGLTVNKQAPSLIMGCFEILKHFLTIPERVAWHLRCCNLFTGASRNSTGFA